MVNKGSFFQRLKERWGSGSGVRVEGRNPGQRPRNDKPNGNVQRVEPERTEPREIANKFAPVDAKSQRKLSEREEALLALGTHFQELTTMLRGSHARVDDQLSKIVAATAGLGTLPGLSQQQLEMLQKLSTQLDRQNTLGEQVATTMTRLPSLLQNVEAALQRAAATDERTASTVREFQATMDRIHGAMGQMVENSNQQVVATQKLAERRDDALREVATGIEASQQRAAAELQRATDEGLQSLRRSHEDQSNRLQRVVEEHAGWNRAVLVGIGLVVLGIGALIVLQLLR
ncbi:MAG: hypothetical protein JNL08_17685 [Planctomycetes bacterium]|nr:hypothetical protein [Planctomycetota bacterium]